MPSHSDQGDFSVSRTKGDRLYHQIKTGESKIPSSSFNEPLYPPSLLNYHMISCAIRGAAVLLCQKRLYFNIYKCTFKQ